MEKEDQSIMYRIYFVALVILLMAVTITFKLTNIQRVNLNLKTL